MITTAVNTSDGKGRVECTCGYNRTFENYHNVPVMAAHHSSTHNPKAPVKFVREGN